LINDRFDSSQRTCWIAEGLLMYLTRDTVSSLMSTLKGLSAPGSEFVFTFMKEQSNGRIRFDSQRNVVDWWLTSRGEPFVWGSTADKLGAVVEPWRVARFFDHNDLRQVESTLTNERIASGEVICLAEI
jgi:O-methyltransferase involved in polyketide biosynthesis